MFDFLTDNNSKSELDRYYESEFRSGTAPKMEDEAASDEKSILYLAGENLKLLIQKLSSLTKEN
jgi:hypothetical protein